MQKQTKIMKNRGTNIWEIMKYMENPLTLLDLYIKPIEMDGKWLLNGWGISNLCAPLRGIPGRGLFFLSKVGPFS